MRYRLTEHSYFMCGIESFCLDVGAVVRITQRDQGNKKILIDFGGGLTGWYSDGILRKFEKIENNEVIND